MDDSIKNYGLSRRAFMGTISGAAAAALLKLDREALADTHPGDPILADYKGRLCYNENPLGPSPAAIDAIMNEAAMSHRYPDWFAESLVSRLANRYDVPTSRVVCGNGATEMLRLCAMAFVEPGHNIVSPYPSYSQFPGDAQFFGANVRYADLDSLYRVDLDNLLARVNSDTTCVCITNPNNPTGTIFDPGQLGDFVDSLPEGVVTLIDEAYFEFINDPLGGDESDHTFYPSAIELVREDKNVVVIKTFSKVYGLAGARIGFAIGKSSAISTMKSNQTYATISRASLEAAKAALNDTQHVINTVSLAGQAREFCCEEFEAMDLSYIPSVTNFMMVEVGDAGDVATALGNRGIYVRTGWGMPHHLRVSMGHLDEMRDFTEALRQILSGRRGKTAAATLPDQPQLYQAYPNPFNTSTTIKIVLPQRQAVKLEMFDIRGRLVIRLADQVLAAGQHSFRWNGTTTAGERVASGSYFYRLVAGDAVVTRRLILIK